METEHPHIETQLQCETVSKIAGGTITTCQKNKMNLLSVTWIEDRNKTKEQNKRIGYQQHPISGQNRMSRNDRGGNDRELRTREEG